MQAALSSRRVLSTVPMHAASEHKPSYLAPSNVASRKFAHSRPPMPRLPAFVALSLSIALLVLIGTALSRFPLECPSPSAPADIIEELQLWRDPEFAKQRLSVYIYDLPPRFNTEHVRRSNENPGRLRDPHCDTNFYSSEVHVHHFLSQSAVRTLDPAQADFFYVPIYTTCDLITHLPNDVAMVGRNFQDAMDIVTQDYPFFNLSNGRNHVYLFTQGFSARLAGNWQRISNGIFMVHNGEFTSPEYSPYKDFTVPPELRAYFKPFWTESENAVENSERQYLAQFGGQVLSQTISDHRGSNYSGGVRQYIHRHLRMRDDYKITGVRSEDYISDMQSSKFCLAPEGWHPWSPRPYYSVMMGCVPVIISEVQELAFEEILDWDSFAVWVRPRDIARLDGILRAVPEADLRRRRAAMKKVWQALWYDERQGGLAGQAILKSLYKRKYRIAPKHSFSSSQ